MNITAAPPADTRAGSHHHGAAVRKSSRQEVRHRRGDARHRQRLVGERPADRDPRTRVPAGFGTRVVQKNQETYVRKAWEQVERILEANRRIRATMFNMLVATKYTVKTINVLEAAPILALSRPVLTKIMGSPTTLLHQMREPVAGGPRRLRRLPPVGAAERQAGQKARRREAIRLLGGSARLERRHAHRRAAEAGAGRIAEHKGSRRPEFSRSRSRRRSRGSRRMHYTATDCAAGALRARGSGERRVRFLCTARGRGSSSVTSSSVSARRPTRTRTTRLPSSYSIPRPRSTRSCAPIDSVPPQPNFNLTISDELNPPPATVVDATSDSVEAKNLSGGAHRPRHAHGHRRAGAGAGRIRSRECAGQGARRVESTHRLPETIVRVRSLPEVHLGRRAQADVPGHGLSGHHRRDVRAARRHLARPPAAEREADPAKHDLAAQDESEVHRIVHGRAQPRDGSQSSSGANIPRTSRAATSDSSGTSTRIIKPTKAPKKPRRSHGTEGRRAERSSQRTTRTSSRSTHGSGRARSEATTRGRPSGAASQVVLLIRGDLLKRYPNTLIFAQKAVPAEAADKPEDRSEDRHRSHETRVRDGVDVPALQGRAAPGHQILRVRHDDRASARRRATGSLHRHARLVLRRSRSAG